MLTWTLVMLAVVAPARARAQSALTNARIAWARIADGVQYAHPRMHLHDGSRVQVFAVAADLCAPGVSLGVTQPADGGQTTSAWGRSHGALAAINGDYFSEALAPSGPSRGAGQWWPADPATWREHHDALFAVGGTSAPAILVAQPSSGPELWLGATAIAADWSDVIAARERVLARGEPRESPAIDHGEGNEHATSRHPRTALGVRADGRTVLLVVVDGRAERSSGVTVAQLAEVLRALGATEGLKLDGGGSSTMYVSGRGVVNHPSDGRERRVGNQVGVFVAASSPSPSTAAGSAPAWCTAGMRIEARAVGAVPPGSTP